MDKTLLKCYEDFIKWYDFRKNVPYDYVYFFAKEENEPKEYPCIIMAHSHDEQCHDEQCCKGPYSRYDLYYHFVYPSDFMPMKRFVTFSINRVVDIVENIPHFERQKYVIECDDLTEAQEIAYDLNSIDGVQYIRINKTNKDKSRKVLSQKDYLKF